MIRTFTIKNKKGWHARPCSRIVKLLKSHPNVTVFFEKMGCVSKRASGKSIFELLQLGLNHGDKVCFILQGNNEFEMRSLSKKLLLLNKQIAKEEELENNMLKEDIYLFNLEKNRKNILKEYNPFSI